MIFAAGQDPGEHQAGVSAGRRSFWGENTGNGGLKIVSAAKKQQPIIS